MNVTADLVKQHMQCSCVLRQSESINLPQCIHVSGYDLFAPEPLVQSVNSQTVTFYANSLVFAFSFPSSSAFAQTWKTL